MDAASEGVDQARNESLAARSARLEHFHDWSLECPAWFIAYSSFPRQQHRGLIPAVHPIAEEDPPVPEADRGHGQPQHPSQPHCEEGVRQPVLPLPVPAAAEL